MTLKQKREIVRRFAAGTSAFICGTMARDFDRIVSSDAWEDAAEQVLRDFMNRKFTLKAKRKARR